MLQYQASQEHPSKRENSSRSPPGNNPPFIALILHSNTTLGSALEGSFDSSCELGAAVALPIHSNTLSRYAHNYILISSVFVYAPAKSII